MVLRKARYAQNAQGYANYPVPTGGTFVNPRVLPPIRTTRIQGFFTPSVVSPSTVDYQKASIPDPAYLKGYGWQTEESTSTDNDGGTLFDAIYPINGGVR